MAAGETVLERKSRACASVVWCVSRGAQCGVPLEYENPMPFVSISGLVVEYIVAIDVTRVRFPADALF